MRSQFRFVEFYRPPDPWVRLDLDAVKARFSANRFNVYNSVQRFPNDRKTEGEPHWCPIYFDFDAEIDKTLEGDQLQEAIRDAVDKSKQDVIKLAQFFFNIGTPSESVEFLFSGMKGFHVVVAPEPFGIEPRVDLTYIIRVLANWLKEYLELQTIDTKIYTLPRQWRIPNSVHPKSKLLSIPIDYNSITGLNSEAIIALAGNPGEAQCSESLAEQQPVIPALADFWGSFSAQFDAQRDILKLTPRIPVKKGRPVPVCVADILENSLKRKGTRNKTLMVLATFLHDTEIPEEEAVQTLTEWSLRIPSTLSTSSESVRRSEVKSVVKTIWHPVQEEKYHFHCAFIRSLGDSDSPIRCNRRDCVTTNELEMEVVKPIDVTLEAAVNSGYMGVPMIVEATVSGKDMTPYVVPARLSVQCTPSTSSQNKLCAICQNAETGVRDIEIKPSDPELLSMVAVSSAQKTGEVKRIAKVPQKCFSQRIVELEFHNIHDLILVPDVEIKPDMQFRRTTFVERRAMYVGQTIETNKPYRFLCRLIPDPKSQYAILQISKAELRHQESNDDISEESLASLETFRAAQNSYNSVMDRLGAIYSDLATNVIRIYDRLDMFIALNTAFHSPLMINFGGEAIRGRIDCAIVGDTRQGKSKMAGALVQHYRAGTLVSGESSSRTGLAWSFQQNGKKWFVRFGVLPLNDGGLVVIDEFGDVDPDDVKKMSQIRSSGIVQVTGIVTASTPARTRLIVMCNPPSGRKLNEYNYGVTSLKDVYKQPEDIARLDFAISVASGEVSFDRLANDDKVEHRFTSQKCSTLVRFAWRLVPEQVEFLQETLRYINAVAKLLCDKYHPQIPLIEPTEVRAKMARLAAAIAVSVFSYSDGRIVVFPCHVEVAFAFLMRIYSKPSMGYDLYSKVMTEEKLSEANEALISSSLTISFGNEINSFITVMLQSVAFRIKDLEEQFGLEPAKAKEIIRMLIRYRLIKATSIGYVKKHSFIALLKKMNSNIEELKQEAELARLQSEKDEQEAG